MAALTARFLNESGAVLGSDVVGNVSPGDRLNTTGLLERDVMGTLPAGTRFVEFTLTNHVVSGWNDGSADNLSFVLTPRPDAPPQILAHSPAADGWQVEVLTRTNRLYVLERSLDLETWTTVALPTPGTGVSEFLADTDAPASHAFYRVAIYRP